MRSYLKEIIVSTTALLIMSLVIMAYLKAVREEKAHNHPEAIYTLIPPNVRTLLVINRPFLFHEMILSNPLLRQAFSGEIPDVMLSVLRTDRLMPLVIISFHSQGVICYIQAGNRTANRITKDFLPERFNFYSPQKRTVNGIDFYYYPDTENHFFGSYVHNGIWVGSYSSKLLERAAEQQLNGEVLFPDEMNALRSSFDTNAPLNMIYPAGELGIDEVRWLSADLFVSEGVVCCHGRLPYEAVGNMYLSLGDALSRQIEKKYPFLRVAFQMNHEEETVYYTGCVPI
jgi:hypothetical protein